MTNKKFHIPKIGRYLVSATILMTSIGLMIGMIYSRKKVEEKDNVDLSPIVAVYHAKKFEGELEIDVSGIVEAHREINLPSQVMGTVKKKWPSSRAGTWVDVDTKLIEIDATNYDFAIKRLSAEKKQAEASKTEMEKELEGLNLSLTLAQREYDLQKQEYDRKIQAGSALSQSELSQTRRALNTADRALTDLQSSIDLSNVRLARLQTAIELSQVRLEEAETDKERCVIKAPFPGVVVSDLVEEGNFVQAGTNVLVFEDTSIADVKCNLRFEQIQQIIKYQVPDSRYQNDPSAAYRLPPTDVTIRRVDGDEITEWEGVLSGYNGIGVDAQTKMIPCIVIVSDPVSTKTWRKGQKKPEAGSDRSGLRPKALVRGMFVKATILLSVADFENETLLSFPSVAVQPGGFVWAVVDDKLQRHKVDVIDRKFAENPDPKQRRVVVRIRDGALVEGSKIVVSPLAQPNPGTQVNVIETIEDPISEDVHSELKEPSDELNEQRISPTKKQSSDPESVGLLPRSEQIQAGQVENGVSSQP